MTMKYIYEVLLTGVGDKMTDIETLTSAELKARLYHSLKEKGLVDQLKVRLCHEFTDISINHLLN